MVLSAPGGNHDAALACGPSRQRRPAAQLPGRHRLGQDPSPRPAPRISRPINDPWIAVGCLARELLLATFNVEDYADFAEHEGLELVL